MFSEGAAVHEQGGFPSEYAPLVERLRSGKVVLCVGSSLGAALGVPGWRALLQALLDNVQGGDAQELEEAAELIDRRPFVTGGFLKRALGAELAGAVLRALGEDSPIPPGLMRLSQLPFRAILSTALDSVAPRALGTGGARRFSHREVAELRRDLRGRFLLQLFGDPRRGEVLFSSGDLQRLVEDEDLLKVLQELGKDRSLLFLGFEDDDPDFEFLVERILPAFGTPRGRAPHFAVLPGLSALVRAELQDHGLKLLPGRDAEDVLQLLWAAIGGDARAALPDDDDLEGWLQILQQDPAREDARAALAALQARLEAEADHDRLVELWLGRVETEAEPARRAECLRRIAGLLEEGKGQMAEAFHSMLAAYREAPDGDTLDQLERLAGVTGQWVELLGELRELLPQLPLSQRVDAWLRIARWYGDKLNHLDYGLASLSEVQKLELGDDETRHRYLELKVDLSRRAERWKDLAEALGQLAELHGAEAQVDRRIDLLLEQGDVYESHLSDGVGAAAAFQRALAVAPQNRDALAALEHLLRRHRKWAELVDLLHRKAALLREEGDDAAALRAQREAAALTTEHLGDHKAAVARWEAIRAQEPGDVEALRALEKLYAQEGGFAERYLEILSALADHVPSDKERLSLYRRLAAEYEDLPGHGKQVEACLEKILDLDPSAEDAYRGLERRYRQDRAWQPLVDTYRRHAEHTQGSRAELYAAIGQIYEVDLPGADRERALLAAPQAIEAWSQVLQLNPEHGGALEALTRLYQLTESYADAVRLLDKRANLLNPVEERAAQAALRHEAAKLSADRLGDPRGAEERFVRALEAEPGHLPSQLALAALYRQQGELLRAAKMLLEAEQRTQNRMEKTRCLVEAAGLFTSLENPRRAIEVYQQALAADPEHEEAGASLADLLWEEKRYADLVPVLEMLTRKVEDRSELLGRLNRLGIAAREAGDRARALKAFARAVELDPANVPAQQSRGQLLMAEGHFQEARDSFAAVLRYGSDSLSAGEGVELYYNQGECERRLERPEEAREHLLRAVELDPTHRPTLQALLLLPGSRPVDAVEWKRALLPSANTEERVKLLTEIGDLLAGELKDPPGALQSYQEALRLKPDSHVLLHKCLDLHSGQGQWGEAVKVLEQLIAQEAQPKRRARYRQAAALIARDEVKDYPRAIALFAAALEDDPGLERSAQGLEDLAQQVGDHRELARIYRRKIKALNPDAEADSKEQRQERIRLWSALGQLCIDSLGDVETGIAAFEVVAALDRGGAGGVNLDRRRHLAALYFMAGPDRFDKAIAEHQNILRANKAELESYRALKSLYLKTRQREKAALVSSALRVLRKADGEDEKLVAELRARPLTPARRPIKAELWRTLQHPEEDPQLGQLFATLLPVVQQGNAKPAADYNLQPKNHLEPSSGHLCAKALRYGVEVLDALTPEAYLAPERKDNWTVVHCAEKGKAPVLCVQLGALLIDPRRPEREMMYEIGRLAATLRPQRALRTLLPLAAQLGTLIDAAMHLAGAPAAAEKVTVTANGLKRSLPPPQLEQVIGHGKALRATGQKAEALATAWLGYADLTAVRAGLLLCGDLEVVAVLLATDPPTDSQLTPKQRLLELLHFAVTEEYFGLRQHLGLNVGL